MAGTTPLPPSRSLTTAQHAALLLVLLAHSPFVRALRDAAASLAGSRPAGWPDAAASRSVSTPQESATPGAGTPGAAVSRNLVETQDMQSLPHAVDVGAQAPAPGATLHDLRPKQHDAVMRWFCNLPLAALDAAITQNRAFPLIDCNPEARAFAPARGKPSPAPMDGAA